MFWILAATALLAFVLAPKWGVRVRLAEWRRGRNRRQLEDGLKYLLSLSQRGQVGTTESLAGLLHLSSGSAINLVKKMETKGLVQCAGGGVQLTPEGERSAIQVVRAHRLLERYLADEAGMPLSKVHQAAERAEHELSSDRLEALDAHLGHPLRDPHGDPIPRADGTFEKLDAIPLTDLYSSDKVYIIHVEDEPDVVLRQILAMGMTPGDSLRILDRGPEFILVSHGGEEHRLAPVIAANIHVRPVPVSPGMPAGSVPLADLPDGATAEVVGMAPQFRGFARRRLLDLGLTPKTRVEAALNGSFGDPRAYRVRGTLIALRKDQAKMVWVREIPPGSATLSRAESITA